LHLFAILRDYDGSGPVLGTPVTIVVTKRCCHPLPGVGFPAVSTSETCSWRAGIPKTKPPRIEVRRCRVLSFDPSSLFVSACFIALKRSYEKVRTLVHDAIQKDTRHQRQDEMADRSVRPKPPYFVTADRLGSPEPPSSV